MPGSSRSERTSVQFGDGAGVSGGSDDVDDVPSLSAERCAVDARPAVPTLSERQLTEILEDLLDTASVEIHDNFFELGGFSLLANRLNARIRDVFGVELPLRSIFESPTIYALTEQIDRLQVERSGANGPTPCTRESTVRLNEGCEKRDRDCC